MPLSRRRFLHLAGGAAALPAASRFARAQSYPARPVRVLVGFAPGGASDIAARLIADWLGKRLGQPFVVENRPGASSNIATEAVVRAAPDGYTLLLVGPPNSINATLYEQLSFNFLRDIVPIASISREPSVMEVNPAVPAKTVPEFIAYAKANPGKINMASSGIGNAGHVAGELFKMMAGVDLLHVPYHGGAPALTDLLAGRTQVMFGNTTTSMVQIRAGKLRPLAVTTATRLKAFPELPTVADFVPGYEASSVYGLGAPRGTPAEIVDKLNREINAALRDDAVAKHLGDLGGVPLPLSPAEFAKLVADETAKWAKVVKFSGAKVH
jgi:tripartite-type tricarboxylate transporter receptor subunit TctC